jgi:uncharacterized protein (TIGR02145 family)
MKKLSLLFIAYYISMSLLYAQNVGINADGTAPANSAMLDVKSTSRGVLIPRMTIAQRNAIESPDEGLMVFCTDCGANGALAIYSNTQWRSYQDCITLPAFPGANVSTVSTIQWVWTSPAGGTTLGYKFNTSNNYETATDKGDVLTYTETGLSCETPYTRYLWAYTGCGVSAPITLTNATNRDPAAPDTSKGPTTDTQIAWKWKVVSGAVGYKWNTVNNVNTATDVGSVLTYTETGLSPFTQQQAYVWAYTDCGNSPTAYLQQVTQAGPCTTATVDYEGVTYHTLQMGTQCWLKENLNIGTKIDKNTDQTNNSVVEKYCYNDDEANCSTYGGLYQWAELVQYMNGATNTANWNPVPAGNVQGLCPPGWHIPSNNDYIALRSIISNLVTTSMGATQEGRAMRENSSYGHWAAPANPAHEGNNYTGFTAVGPGYRNTISPAYWASFNAGAFLWTSTTYSQTASTCYTLTNSTTYISSGTPTKTYGLSVRCLKD